MRMTIPVFFACDDNYIPFLATAICSLAENSTKENDYKIYVLTDGVNAESERKILNMKRDNISVEFVDVTEKIEPIKENLNLRDYYTPTIYYRLFIPELFPEYDRAIYLDSDMVILDDIAKLYVKELGDDLLAGVPDAIIASRKTFIDYSEMACGIRYDRYFNSGMLLMNLAEMRKLDLENMFIGMLNRYHFNTICPDQDYLNVICKDRVVYLDKGWNKMSIDDNYDGVPHIVHYNMFNKPWQYDNVPYGKYFWKYAEMTEFYDAILSIRRAFGKKDEEMQELGLVNLIDSAKKISMSDDNFRCVLDICCV